MFSELPRPSRCSKKLIKVQRLRRVCLDDILSLIWIIVPTSESAATLFDGATRRQKFRRPPPSPSSSAPPPSSGVFLGLGENNVSAVFRVHAKHSESVGAAGCRFVFFPASSKRATRSTLTAAPSWRIYRPFFFFGKSDSAGSSASTGTSGIPLSLPN